MRILILLVFLCASVSITIQENYDEGTLDNVVQDSCDENADISMEYRTAIYDFTIALFKTLALRGGLNFVYSPVSIWLILAAAAEGADPHSQKQLFQTLHLPNNLCNRKKFYQMAASTVVHSDDIKIVNNRVWLIDDAVTPNPTWHDIVKESYHLEVVRAAIRNNPEATALDISRLMSAPIPRLNLIGNSVLLDSIDYSGLWTTSFADAKIERAPFFNQQGYPIGSVDLMRVKRRARMGYLKSVNIKILELPVGTNGRYRMMFGMFLDSSEPSQRIGGFSIELLKEVLESLKESDVPVDIAIPRMVISSVIDVRTLLEDLGVTSLWTDPAATRQVSEPPALPSSFIHRATLSLNQFGLSSAPVQVDTPLSAPTGLDPILGREFIANRPFLFALFDSKTYTCVMGSAYSVPTFL